MSLDWGLPCAVDDSEMAKPARWLQGRLALELRFVSWYLILHETWTCGTHAAADGPVGHVVG